MSKPVEFKNVGVDLPPTVVAILKAAGADDPKRGGMPFAMASILGALPWIAVELWKTLPPEEYRAFAGQIHANMRQVWDIVGSTDPQAAFDAAFAAAKKAVN